MMTEVGSYLKLLVTVGRDAVVAGNLNCAMTDLDTAKEGWVCAPLRALGL